MNNVKPIIFFSKHCFYFYSHLIFFVIKKASDKKTFNRLVFTIPVIAFLLNFAWEVIQIPLYKDSSYSVGHIIFCALALVADAIMTLLLYLGLGFVFKNPFWISDLKWYKVVVVILIGGTGATLAEIWHVSFGNWSYADTMPIIPIVMVGISPVLQFITLLLVVYYLSYYRLKMMRHNEQSC
jgi:hypothetical protein